MCIRGCDIVYGFNKELAGYGYNPILISKLLFFMASPEELSAGYGYNPTLISKLRQT